MADKRRDERTDTSRGTCIQGFLEPHSKHVVVGYRHDLKSMRDGRENENMNASEFTANWRTREHSKRREHYSNSQ